MTENDAELNPDPHGIGAIRPSEHKIGDPVRYYPVLPNIGEVPGYEVTKIRSEPWQLGHGAWVIKVEGRTGGVLTEHLAPIPAGTASLLPLGSGPKIAFDDVIDFLITNGIELSTVNQAMVEAALAKHKGNQTAAAAQIGLTRDQLRYRLSKARDKQSSE
jgi:hypothetical protein